MKIAVIDDQQNDINHFTYLARLYFEINKIPLTIHEFLCGEIFFASPLVTVFDAAFVDIYMTGMNGVDTAKRIKQLSPNCKIIFVTTSSDHAVEGFEIGAVHYLIKPITMEQLSAAMGRILKSLPNTDKYIEVKSGRTIRKLRLSEIHYVDYYEHAVQVHTTDDVIKSFMKFVDIEKELLSNPNFIWCYRNIVVNMDEISYMEDREILLQNEVRLPINKQKATVIRNCYADYIFNKMRSTTQS